MGITEEVNEKTESETPLITLLLRLSNPMNWGYFDDSGCPKGAGNYKDAWIGGEPHPIKEAQKILDVLNS